MFKSVDDCVIEGFCYQNFDDVRETVEMDYNQSVPTVCITDGEDRLAYIYKEDLPKLIKALQAAYDFKGN